MIYKKVKRGWWNIPETGEEYKQKDRWWELGVPLEKEVENGIGDFQEGKDFYICLWRADICLEMQKY